MNIICPPLTLQRTFFRKILTLAKYFSLSYYNGQFFGSYIHRALAYAVKTERLNRNPADNVELPKIEKHLANYYSAYELNKLLDYARGKPIEIIVRLAAWFGLRRGEIIGLRWSYIDFDRAVLTVAGVVKDKGNPNKSRELYYEPTAKTAASLCSFPMPQSA